MSSSMLPVTEAQAVRVPANNAWVFALSATLMAFKNELNNGAAFRDGLIIVVSAAARNGTTARRCLHTHWTCDVVG